MRSFKQFFENTEEPQYDEQGYRIVSYDEQMRKLDEFFRRYKGGNIPAVITPWGNVTEMPPSCPRVITGSFSCSHKNLNTLKNGPVKVTGSFNCEYNNLTSLEGSPRIVGGDFYCDGNEIKSLDGAPDHIGGEFGSSYFTDSDYREFIAKRKYKQVALSGTEDEAGLGSVIDVL